MQVNVFTDGSCIKKEGQCYAGYGITFPEKELKDMSGRFTKENPTNQRAELYAIYVALKKIIENIEFRKINIYTDSEYSIKSLSIWMYKWAKNNWISSNKKTVKNLDIIKPLYEIINKYKARISLIHVKAHTKKLDYYSKNNERADKLAVEGAKRQIKKKMMKENQDVEKKKKNKEEKKN